MRHPVYTTFGAVVLLLLATAELRGWSLLRLGKECRTIGIKSLRAANAVVLALGLSFIFLTFHNGEKNYIYPLVSGV